MPSQALADKGDLPAAGDGLDAPLCTAACRTGSGCRRRPLPLSCALLALKSMLRSALTTVLPGRDIERAALAQAALAAAGARAACRAVIAERVLTRLARPDRTIAAPAGAAAVVDADAAAAVLCARRAGP